jgi:3-isopropylmalate/(R)-2-methylmalate dehydratase small subunit
MDHVDTDQIIPARFLKVTNKEGLGRHLFADWRYDAEGNPRSDFVLNRPETAKGEVLVVGENFGCGSSREHAPWALYDYGFRAVVGTSIADIFRNNATKNGLLPVVVDGQTQRFLMNNPGLEVTIDLEQKLLLLPNGRQVGFPIDGFARYCLIHAMDELDFLIEQEEHIATFESRP